MRSSVDLLCFSHLRWNFVFQRPQHLLSRCARERKVYFFEEPIFEGTHEALRVAATDSGVTVVTPVVPRTLDQMSARVIHRQLIQEFIAKQNISQYIAWYYTPMGLGWYKSDNAVATVYDCMDELSLFKGASEELKHREQDLFKRADLVFTGGVSLYHHKRSMHPNVYAFPSSVDVHHFAQARDCKQDPADQSGIAHPRLGYFGVIDERTDLDLLADLADLRPEFQIVLVGPVVKIDPAALPQRKNIHYLGPKSYDQLPFYLSGWDVAIMPFARNDATRFISPTKTPEYLAAGKPVVSTSIQDVVSPYGDNGYVRIADTAKDFALACAAAIKEDAQTRLALVDPFLAKMSWDSTWRSMSELVDSVVALKLEAVSRDRI
jgi:UDP-galactopyranose mutase